MTTDSVPADPSPAPGPATPFEVSVVLCVRDGAATLPRQLAALAAQRGAPPFEVIVVDNGSRDGTRDLVRAWAESITATADHRSGPIRASLLDAGDPPGIPRVRNLGARAARGRVLAFCDADDEVQPGWVAAFAAAVDADQLAGGAILARTPEGLRPALGGGLAATPYLPHVGSGNCAIARDTFWELGGFDESLPRYGFEDVELSWRHQEAGHPVILVPEARLVVSGDTAVSSLRKKLLLGRGRVLMASRFPAYDPTRYTVPGTARDLARAGGRLLRAAAAGRAPSRRELSELVALAGRVTGAVRYRDPARHARRLAAAPAPAPRARIALAANQGEIGGGEVMLLQLGAALQELGIDVTVLAPTGADGLSGVLRAAADRGLDIRPLPARGRAGHLLVLARWRRRHREVPMWCLGLLPSLATAGSRGRIVHLHRLPRGLSGLLLPLARRGADAVLVPSQDLAARLPGSRVLENWTVDIPHRPRPRDAAAPRIGFLGRLEAEKGVADLLAAWPAVLDGTGRRARLVLAGEPRFAGSREDAALAAALEDLEPAVERPGWVERAALLAGIDLLVVPSRVPESFGLAAAEAMAAGVSVVATDIGALPEVLGPDHARLARPGDPADLARAILAALAEDPAERERRLTAARARWERCYSPARGRQRVAALLAELSAGSAAPRRPGDAHV